MPMIPPQAIQEVLEDNCTVVSNWIIDNQFKLIADKTHIMTLGTQERLSLLGNKVSIEMDGLVLRKSNDKSEPLLGLKPEMAQSDYQASHQVKE